MKMKRLRFLEWLRWVLVLVVILWGINSVHAQQIGKTIDKSNSKEYETLLIPAMLEAVKRGDFILPTGNLNFPIKHWDRFISASEKNEGKFDVNPEGDSIDKTGKIPNYNIYGMPFPKIDPKDPNAAVKIMWNFNFQRYRYMGVAQNTNNMLVARTGGLERYFKLIASAMYYQCRLPGNEVKNPQGFLMNDMFALYDPMSMKGTNMLDWEYFDERDTTSFAYIPAIRRVRQTSGVSRSDQAWGADGCLDFYYVWGGKNRTMKWKLVGERTILTFFTQTNKEITEEAADGTVTFKIPYIKWGFQTKDWKGANWAPLSVTFVPRKVWVIEQFPKDPYYNWGLHTNYIDKETYVNWVKEVYNRAGEFRAWVGQLTHYGEAPSGNNIVGICDSQLTIDEKVRHATLSDTSGSSARAFMPASKLGKEYFTLSNFLQISK